MYTFAEADETEAPQEETPVKAAVKKVQTALQQKGLYSGSVSGEYNTATHEALSRLAKRFAFRLWDRVPLRCFQCFSYNYRLVEFLTMYELATTEEATLVKEAAKPFPNPPAGFFTPIKTPPSQQFEVIPRPEGGCPDTHPIPYSQSCTGPDGKTVVYKQTCQNYPLIVGGPSVTRPPVAEELYMRTSVATPTTRLSPCTQEQLAQPTLTPATTTTSTTAVKTANPQPSQLARNVALALAVAAAIALISVVMQPPRAA